MMTLVRSRVDPVDDDPLIASTGRLYFLPDVLKQSAILWHVEADAIAHNLSPENAVDDYVDDRECNMEEQWVDSQALDVNARRLAKLAKEEKERTFKLRAEMCVVASR